MKSKRGISPLIATVLLIGFTIAMAGVVTTFVIKQTKETFNPEKLIEDSSLCDQMTLGVVVPDPDKLMIGMSDTANSPLGYLKGVTIQNKGSYSIRGFIVVTDGMKGETPYMFDGELAKLMGMKGSTTNPDGTSVNKPTIESGGASQNKIDPGKIYEFGYDTKNGGCLTGTICGIPIIPGSATHNIKIYPIVKDFEKKEPIKCAKSVITFDYGTICTSYGHKAVTDTPPCGIISTI